MSHRLVLTTPLGGSPLSLAMQRGEVSAQWHRVIAGTGEWRAAAAVTRDRFPFGAWLEALRPAIAPAGLAEQRLARVQRQGGVLVTTGQQPGLFGGPIYTWTKAISALALADALEEATGIPAAPLFWAATDDSDFAEARGTLLAVSGGIRAIALGSAPAAGTSMSAARLGDTSALLQALDAASGGGAYQPALDAVRAAYAEPSGSVGGAYVALLREVLATLGVGVLDASHPAVRTTAASLLRTAHERAAEVEVALRERDEEIRSAGFTPQVEHVPGMSLVFVTESGVRRRLAVGESLAGVRDDALSPNVLLRPVVERAILPTVAYAAGPGELAYFAQVSAVSDALGLERPHAVPRWSGMILEPRIRRALERLELTPDDVRSPTHAAALLAGRHLPADVRAALESLGASVQRAVEDVRAADRGGLVEEAVLEGVSRSMSHRVERLRRRYLAAVRRRESGVMHDLATVQGALYPEGVPQERVINLLPILARCGVSLFDAMRAAAREHAFRLLGPGAARRAVAGEDAPLERTT